MTKGWETVGANEEVVQEAGTSIEGKHTLYHSDNYFLSPSGVMFIVC